jgi:hypothetical protein
MNAVAQDILLPIQSPRGSSTTTVCLVAADILAVECALYLGCLLRSMLQSLVPIVIRAPEYEMLCIGVLTLPVGYYCMGLYPGYGIGAVTRLKSCLCDPARLLGSALVEFFVRAGPMVPRNTPRHNAFLAHSPTFV